MKQSTAILFVLALCLFGCNRPTPEVTTSEEPKEEEQVETKAAMKATFTGLPTGPTLGASGATFKFSKGWNGFEAGKGKFDAKSLMPHDIQVDALQALGDTYLADKTCKFIAFGPLRSKEARQHMTLHVSTSPSTPNASTDTWDIATKTLTHKGKHFTFTMYAAPGNKAVNEQMLNTLVESVDFSSK